MNQDLIKIFENDPEMGKAIDNLIAYLATTYDDKYAKSCLDNKGVIYDPMLGKGFNTGNAAKYIARYMTFDFAKSNDPKDLTKAIHYLLFELVRREKDTREKPDDIISSQEFNKQCLQQPVEYKTTIKYRGEFVKNDKELINVVQEYMNALGYSEQEYQLTCPIQYKEYQEAKDRNMNRLFGIE